MNNYERHYIDLIARAKNQEIEDFSDEEIERVFKKTVLKTKNIEKFKELVNKNISLVDIYSFNEKELLKIIKED
jgi:hypothetical protein